MRYGALGMVGQELAGLVDQVGERGAGQRLGADRSSTSFRSTADRRAATSVLSVARQGEDLGAAGRVGELAEERVELGQRLLGVVDGREREGLGVDFLPPLVVADQLARLLDLADGRGELGRLVLDRRRAVRPGRGRWSRWRPGRRPP